MSWRDEPVTKGELHDMCLAEAARIKMGLDEVLKTRILRSAPAAKKTIELLQTVTTSTLNGLASRLSR